MMLRTKPNVDRVRWTPLPGVQDEMKPVKGWVVLSETDPPLTAVSLPRPPREQGSVVEAFDASGRTMETLAVDDVNPPNGPIECRPIPGRPTSSLSQH